MSVRAEAHGPLSYIIIYLYHMPNYSFPVQVVCCVKLSSRMGSHQSWFPQLRGGWVFMHYGFLQDSSKVRLSSSYVLLGKQSLCHGRNLRSSADYDYHHRKHLLKCPILRSFVCGDSEMLSF